MVDFLLIALIVVNINSYFGLAALFKPDELSGRDLIRADLFWFRNHHVGPWRKTACCYVNKLGPFV